MNRKPTIPGTRGGTDRLLANEPAMESKNGSQEHETHIVDAGGSPGVIAGIVIVALLVLASLLLLNWNGDSRTVDIDVPAVTVDEHPDGQ